MEIDKSSQPEKSAKKMVTGDSPKAESCTSYYPDFSDIYDESYEFWDFLHSKKDGNESVSREEERHQKTNFWDFLGPSSNKDQNGPGSENIDSSVATHNDSGIHFENESQLCSEIKNNAGARVPKGINLQSPELKSTSSDEEFWDFLSCNSPVVTFKELIKDYNSTNGAKESGIGSFVSRCDESPFPTVSEYMESEGCSTINSSPSSVSERTKQFHGNESVRKEFNSIQNFNRKYSDKPKESVESIDYTSYIDVLKYLQQECFVSNRGDNQSSISNDTSFYGNLSRINIKESEKYQTLDISDKSDKCNEKGGKMQELSQGSSNSSRLNVSSTSQRPVYDGIAPILSSNSNSGALRKDVNSYGMNSFKVNGHKRGRFQQLITKRPTKRFKRNISNLSVASHNAVANSKPALTNTCLNAVNVVNFNQPNMQASLQNLKSANSCNTEQGIKNINTTRVNSLGINTTVATTPALAVTANNSTASNTSTPVYLLMPTNSETLQNPNYSHFFLVINNNNNGNAQMNQTSFIQNPEVAANRNNLKNTAIQSGQALQTKVNSEIGVKSDNVKQNIFIVNQPNTIEPSSSVSAAKSSLSNIKYQTIPQVYLPYSSLINSTAGTNQARIQYLNNIPAVNSTVNIPVSVNNLVSSSEVPRTVQNVTLSSAPITNFYTTVKSSGVAEQVTKLKLDLKNKTVPSTCRQPPLKPIKNIPLGNNKYAIQQISTPVQICGSEELNNSVGYSNLNKINENFFLEKTVVENKLAPRINNVASEPLGNNISSFRDALSAITSKSAILPQNESCQSIIFTSTNVGTSSNLTPSVCLMGKNANFQEKVQISSANSTNVNVVPVSGSLEINKAVSTVNSIQTINAKDKQNSSCISLKTSNNLVPIKVVNPQSKSLATLQGLFPPPISMVPVCVLPQTQITSQASTSKVFVLNGNGKPQTATHKVKIDPIPNRERPISKKMREKLKKGRLKTVRELLQERRKTGSNHSRGSKKTGKEIRVLRPVLRLSTCDVCPGKPSPIITNISKLNTDVTSNNTEVTATRKRPNILLLPSSKTLKGSFTEDKQASLEKEQESEFFADSSVSENVGDSLSSYANSAVDKKDTRPRHYDMSQLNIGDFRVDDDIDSCGRFRSKFKVTFSKRLFYYDFPVSRCNQYSLKSTDAWEQMARVSVAFKTVVSMSLSERTIEISINAPPAIALGRLQARTGIIPNSTMYDTAVESDCAWGCMIRSSFHHKIILRKKQANKLKSFLCHFDDRFLNIINVGLCERGMNSVDELSIFEGELSPTTLKQNVTKNKKHYIRRLSQWDSSENEDQKTVDEDDLVLLNQMCSCRVSCRSIRCSCVKAAKSCNSVCDCVNCDNPLNILETLGMNLDFSLSDSCLFQNIYQIPKLVPFLTKEVKLTCCNTFARVQDCIPGTVLCPNVDCNVPLEFSWCKKVVCYPERNPRNHCSFCGQCCFSNGRHCLTCNRCYVATPKLPYCPTCQEKTSIATLKDMEANFYNCDTKDHDEPPKSVTKSVQKPEIVILDVYSLAKTSFKTENADESTNLERSADGDDSTVLEDYTKSQDSEDSAITID